MEEGGGGEGGRLLGNLVSLPFLFHAFSCSRLFLGPTIRSDLDFRCLGFLPVSLQGPTSTSERSFPRAHSPCITVVAERALSLFLVGDLEMLEGECLLLVVFHGPTYDYYFCLIFVFLLRFLTVWGLKSTFLSRDF